MSNKTEVAKRVIERAEAEIGLIDKAIENTRETTEIIHSLNKGDSRLLTMIKGTTDSGEIQKIMGNLEMMKSHLKSVIRDFEPLLTEAANE